MTDQQQYTQQQYPCASCGARLTFAPGTTALKCPYCGFEQEVARDENRVVREHDYDLWMATAQSMPVSQIAAHTVTCTGCGARTETDKLSDACPFCGAAIVVEANTDIMITPEGVLPFAIASDKAMDLLQAWVRSRWFAPNSLKSLAAREGIQGTYLPYWTYDSDTMTMYHGQRGDYYYETETYRDSDGEEQERQVRKIRWWPAYGQVERIFDDILVPAVTRLPSKRVEALEPWDIPAAVPYQPEFLAGYQTLRYEVEPPAGLEQFKQIAERQIERDCRDDIGGDEQRVTSMDTQWNAITFKLLLLPVWLAAYRFDNKTWQVMINARTGEVIGDRPYSVAKIVSAVIAALVVVGLAVLAYTMFQGR
ncbi:TFIIB-type zinc ribbon-containing protein [Kineosporia succinea]|uniref:RNA-binding Zn-ribbon protein involved in translation (DUF1610 family) n=1 Tax=Kineosporia succinea TaxID=84632 RepID=A0ABT9P8A3_9ACTN|nr:hypothetical protein [Kineosporia succinea]MDP9828924.1 putative RNA-binding Zn-ribbon protein involved in translation (DUF1610 family) [Kineosporia succinea]